MDIGILGTGIVGQTLGSRLVELGHRVKMGSRVHDNGNARAWVRVVGELASQGTYAEAGEFGKILFNCTAGKGSLSAVGSIKTADLNHKILIDLANPLDYTHGNKPVLTVCNYDSLGEQMQREHKMLRVVKALNTMNVNVMVHPELVKKPHDVLLCGNDSEAKAFVTQILIEWFGWDTIIDLGDISNSRGMEMVLPLWLAIQKKVGSNIFNIHVSI